MSDVRTHKAGMYNDFLCEYVEFLRGSHGVSILNKLEGNNRFFIVIIFFVVLFFRYPRAVSHEWERVFESLINLR